MDIDKTKSENTPEKDSKLHGLHKKLIEAYKMEELHWSQKGRINWLKEGGQKHRILPCNGG